jgi:hypothetical protein
MSTKDERVVELELEQQPVRAPTTVAPPPEGASPLDRIADLLARGITPEQVDSFLDVQRKWEADQASKAYVRAMAAFKAEPIATIIKKKRVSFKTKRKDGSDGGTLEYKHETLDQVVDAVVAPMAKHGLSHKWDVSQDKQTRLITVCCIVTHEHGGSDSSELFGLPDDSGHKNPLQQVRSTITFLQRATLLLITGLAAKGEDDDGGRPRSDAPRSGKPETSKPKASGGNALASEQQLGLLSKKLQQASIPENELLAHFELGALSELPFGKVNDALAWIKKAAQ